jgi:hypothetical protein
VVSVEVNRLLDILDDVTNMDSFIRISHLPCSPTTHS